MQRPVVSTLCQETKKHRNQKVGSEGTPKLDPFWKSQPVTWTVSSELRSESLSTNKDDSHSWVRISHGLNKLVTNLSNIEQETSEVQFEEHALKFDAIDLASRSKAKAKPQKRNFSSSSTKTVPIGERTRTDVEPGEYSIADFAVSKKLIHLLRHGKLHREDDGAIEFWRIKGRSS